MIGAIVAFVMAHLDIVDLIYDAVVNHKVDRQKIVDAVKREIVEASEARMRAELK